MRRTFAVAIVVIVGVGHAHAQSSDANASAEQLFKEGRVLATANRWADACPKFEASLRHDHAFGTLLNIAVCHEHFGRLASAWSTYRQCADMARKDHNEERRAHAEERAAALESRLPRLTIITRARQPGLVVMRNGTRLDPGALGVALYVDPGPHQITASAPSFVPFVRQVTAIEGRSETLEIPDLWPLRRVPTQPSMGPTSPGNGTAIALDPVERASRTAKHIAIGAGTVGLAALGTALVFKMRSDAASAELDELCPGEGDVCTSQNTTAGMRLLENEQSNMTNAKVFGVIGAVGVGTAVIAFVLTPSRQPSSARVTPTVQARGAGLAIIGRF
jgi:hypothetical protein